MAKFMLLYLSPVGAEQQMAGRTPEEMQKGMEPWMAWFGKLGSAVVDGGQPLGQGVNMSPSGAGDRKTQVAGYSFIEASDMNAAKSLVEGHPHFMAPQASVEILEVLPMM